MTSAAQNSKQSLSQSGTASAPGIAFLGDQDTGFARSASGTVDFMSNGTKVGSFGPTGVQSPSRVVVIADATSITINADTTDIATQANTQAVGTLTVNAPSGTPVNGQKIILRLSSTNTQTFSWNSVFAGSSDIGLPSISSGAGLYDYMGFMYNSTAAKWQMLARNMGF